MKRGYKLLSSILVLSLLFSSMVFTVGAAEEESSNNVGDYIDENVELFTPSATYTTVTAANATSVLNSLLADGSETDRFHPANVFGGNNLDMHLVESDGYEDYLMIVPTEAAIANGCKVADQAQINTYVDENVTYNAANPSYYIFEADVATESGVLPIFYQVVTRNIEQIKDENGNVIGNWGSAWKPGAVTNSLYMTMTPGVFHHLTVLSDIDNNKVHVYIDNQLVTSVNNGVTNANLHQKYLEGAGALRIEGMRIELSGTDSVAFTANSSYCIKNLYEQVMTGTESNGLKDYAGKPTLQGWAGNRFSSHAHDTLPPLISVNDVEYTNIIDASAALNAYNAGNVAKLRRAVLSGSITVDCDATIHTYSTGVSLIPGEHTTLTKVNGSVYKATLHSPKYSNKLITSNPASGLNLSDYLRYDLAGNIISSVELQHSVTVPSGATEAEKEAIIAEAISHSANGDIMQSDRGNHYFYVYDNYDGAFDSRMHFYLNATVPHTSANSIAGHEFIVFDFDIFAESELINVYNGFIPRSLTNNAPLSARTFYLTSNLEKDNYIKIESGEWSHFTFVGEVATGKAYVYINNTLVETLDNGLYTQYKDEGGNLYALDGSGNQYPLSDVTINMFRCMQIAAGESANTLTQNMSVCVDNFDARFVDGDSTLQPGMSSLDSWVTNLYGNGYHFAELPAIATVDGVQYYDTLSLTEALNDPDFTGGKKDVIFSRNFIGTVNVNCRATIKTQGVNGNITYSDRVWTATTSDSYGYDVVEVYFNQTEDIPAHTNTWTESTEGTFPNQNLTAATNDTIIANIKRAVSDNKYNKHTMGSGASWIAKQFVSANQKSDGSYEPVYGDGYLLDNAAQTHTLGFDSALNVTPTYTANVTIKNNSFLGSGSTTVTEFRSTEVKYYMIAEFDASNIKKGNASTLTVNATIGGNQTGVTVLSDIGTMLENSTAYANNEFEHITIIGEVDVNVNTTVARSGSISYSYSYSITGYTYKITYKAYLNNAKIGEVSTSEYSSNSASTVSWTGMTLTVGSGSELAIDNMYMSFGSETITTTLPSGTKISVSGTASTNASNLASVVTSSGTSTEAGSTTADNVFTTNTIDDNTYGMTDSYQLPSSVEEGETEDTYVTKVEEKSEYVPEVELPIACVNGELYYESNEDELRELLENADGDTEVLEVTILRDPTEKYVIGANAIIDTNGMSNSSVYEYDESKEFATTIVGGSTNVIVVGQTTILASLNGTNYYNIDDLQTALTLTESAELVFYTQPSSPLKITCPAIITTNGFTNLYTLDEYVFTTSESAGVITIAEQTATPNIRFVVDGVETINEPVKYGTDIADFLKHHGVVSAAVAVDGEIYTGVSYTSSVAEYLVDGRPAGRITKDVTFNVSYTTHWDEAYIVVNNDGTIASLASYDTATLLSRFANSNTEAIILADDIVLTETDSHSMAGSGEISLYLNGHTITYDAIEGSAGVHTWAIGPNGADSADYNFYGPGTINSTTMNNTQGIIFANYGYNGNIRFQDLTINVSHSVAQLRGGNMEVIDCDINAYLPVSTGNSDSRVGVMGLFTLGEDVEASKQSTTEMSLIITGSDVDFRYYEVDNRFKDRTSDIPLIYHKIVSSGGSTDPKTTILIDNSHVKAQGSIVKACHTVNSSTTATVDGNTVLAAELSNMKLWINKSTVIARSITEQELKSKSVIFYEDVRTNIKNVSEVSFVAHLIKTKSSDGLLPYLYTSHDYATVTWSDGTTEYWASGSTPTNNECKFDNVEIVEAGMTYTFNQTTTSAPFKLYANLTLADVIGFNIYIPADVDIQAVYLDGVLVEKGVKADGSNTTPVGAAGGAACYFYTITLDPQVSAKEFTLVAVVGQGSGAKVVSRTLSVGVYATALANTYSGKTTPSAVKNNALLSVALHYIEQATMYSAYNLDMSTISAVLDKVNVTSFSATATETDTSAISAYLTSASINLKDTCAFRFDVAPGADISDLTFTVDGTTREYTIAPDGSYVELSLRAYEMARTITINVGGAEGTYDLYTYYAYLNANAGIATTEQCEFNQALQLVKALYTYAIVTDQYVDAPAIN